MNELVERQLTATEIRQRQVDHLRLLTEIDNYEDEAAEHKRCIKEATQEIERLQQRERLVRRELRSGTVFEARQKEMAFTLRPLGIDGETDEPDPETDPQGPTLEQLYPLANDHGKLRGDIGVALQGIGTPSLDQLRQWHPESGVFQALAHWARVELAYMNAAEHPDLVLPEREPVPVKLAELLEQNSVASHTGQAPLNGKTRKRKRPAAEA